MYAMPGRSNLNALALSLKQQRINYMKLKNTTDKTIFLDKGHRFEPGDVADCSEKLSALLLDKFNLEVIDDAPNKSAAKNTESTTKSKPRKKKE